ncbi:bifunctional UDP-sugar hydrolase/5'-nucleotidase [Anaeromyxobacter sp. PSR-1]|uniref:bifunctional metallophosphatase/5'-nucleotidase n=1 Tax=Anaeromyxobacter sp. PSR-1 TaxID=1300915 RepID=UPI0005DDC424|nr:5'-nucleotidase C-terminal domain-containing protein [Anaeromyxobacter sp. PSR-1]GAO02057.1 5'-nucleotidase [Anaeromyxobacter sp. PSR-1]
MSHATRRLACALLATALAAGPGPAEATALTILSVNDTHSNLDAAGPKDASLDGTVGGLVKASAVIARLRAEEPNTVFLHAGDLFMGDLYFNATFGSVELQLLGLLGLDAMAVGNHELWFPGCVLAGSYLAAGGSFPLLAANATPFECAGMVAPHALLGVGDLKVAVVGLTTPFDLPSQANAAFTGGDDPPLGMLAAAQAAVAAARTVDEDGDGVPDAQAVIVLSHLGQLLDEAIAANVIGVDAVVGGHDHYELAELVPGASGRPVPVVHAGAYYRKVGRVRLDVEPTGVSAVSVDLVPVDRTVARPAPSPTSVPGAVALAVAQLQAAIPVIFAPFFPPPFEDPFHTPIAYAAGNVTNAIRFDKPKRDTGTGNLITDALRLRRPGTDLAFTVAGQTPQGIAEGPVVQEDLFRMVGVSFDPVTYFGTRIAIGRIRGDVLLTALELAIGISTADDDYVPQLSGARLVYDSSLAAPPRIRSLEVGGVPVAPAATYSIAMNAFVYQLLPSLGIELVPGTGQVLDDFEFLALRDHVVALGTFESSGENRVRDLAARGPNR